MKIDKKFLIEYLDKRSPTGFEIEGQKSWLNYIKKYSNSVNNDSYGNGWAIINAKKNSTKAQKIMIEAHADEIGFMVKNITNDGFIYVNSIGGSDVSIARGKRVKIIGDKGIIDGIFGNTAIHIVEKNQFDKTPKINELFIEVGAKNKKEVEKMGIRPGCPIVYKDSTDFFGKKMICGRALDNRIGGYILTQLFKELFNNKPELQWDIYAVNAVQEEIGGNGARMMAHRIRPDIAIVLDVTHATDTPNININKHGNIKLGKGPSISHGTCNHPELVKKIQKIAESKKIPLQHEGSSRYSGTDTDVIFFSRDGIPSSLISIPLRYMHSPIELVNLNDVRQTIELLSELVKNLKNKEEFKVKI